MEPFVSRAQFVQNLAAASKLVNNAPMESRVTTTANPRSQLANAGEVLAAFLRLGVSSFGGPIAHIGYLREEFVVRRGWSSTPSTRNAATIE